METKRTLLTIFKQHEIVDTHNKVGNKKYIRISNKQQGFRHNRFTTHDIFPKMQVRDKVFKTKN